MQRQDNITPNKNCVSCSEVIPDGEALTCPCNHIYCPPCLVQHFSTRIEGSGFPPRCCTIVIPIELVRRHLSTEILQKFDARKLEVEDPTAIFCASLNCQNRLSTTSFDGEKAICTCGTITCVQCRFTAHDGPCPEDGARVALLEMAVRLNWRSCPQCGNMIERVDGCHHMMYEIFLHS